MIRTIDLDPALEAFIQSQLETGRYASADAVIEDALRQLRERDSAPLDAELMRSLAEAERGELFDADLVFNELEHEIEGIIRSRRT